MNATTRRWARPPLWDTTQPPHLAVPALVLRWVHSGGRFRRRAFYAVLIWQLVGIFVLSVAAPVFAAPNDNGGTTNNGGGSSSTSAPAGNKSKDPNPADTSMFGWISIKDSSNIPIADYFIAVDQGSAFSLIPGNGDKKANIALAPILELEYGIIKITVQFGIWVIIYGLSLKWLSFIAAPFNKLGSATEHITTSMPLLLLALTIAGGIAALAFMRGHHGKAAYQVGSAIVITGLMASFFAHPVAQLVGPDGYLAKARDVGVTISQGLADSTAESPAGEPSTINRLGTSLADGFLRTPTQLLNFNASADKLGCKEVWNKGIRSHDRDKLKDDIATCGKAGKDMKFAADHLTGDRLASAAFIQLLASILLIFGCYLIGKMALLTVLALINALMLPVVGTLGVIAGVCQGMAFKCLCNIGLSLVKLSLTVIYAGAYTALLGSMLNNTTIGSPTQTLVFCVLLLVIAIIASRRLEVGLRQGHSSALNFLTRGGPTEMPKPQVPSVVKSTATMALHAGAAALGVPPHVSGLAVAAGKNMRQRGRGPNQMPAGAPTGPSAPDPSTQQQWWDQQNQWYGAQQQWYAQQQSQSQYFYSGSDATTQPIPVINPNAPEPDPGRTAPSVSHYIQQAPPLHPAVASALNAMPQQIQPAASMPAESMAAPASSDHNAPRRSPRRAPASAPVPADVPRRPQAGSPASAGDRPRRAPAANPVSAAVLAGPTDPSDPDGQLDSAPAGQSARQGLPFWSPEYVRYGPEGRPQSVTEQRQRYPHLCGARTTRGDYCINPAGSCPHHPRT